ncbi:hypothetical protein RRG08_004544 [Elysia crispata]|uniref:Uncharacterized protein n=1 Tax=Elysia crispata TaxID=231223 RepID=A0AAE1BBN7_9GAST|nr:hypothetical protein RRG08_004544 [Elysia crispata]
MVICQKLQHVQTGPTTGGSHRRGQHGQTGSYRPLDKSHVNSTCRLVPPQVGPTDVDSTGRLVPTDHWINLTWTARADWFHRPLDKSYVDSTGRLFHRPLDKSYVDSTGRLSHRPLDKSYVDSTGRLSHRPLGKSYVDSTGRLSHRPLDKYHVEQTDRLVARVLDKSHQKSKKSMRFSGHLISCHVRTDKLMLIIMLNLA